MADPFAQLDESINDRLGVDAVLRNGEADEESVRVVLHRGVAFQGEHGQDTFVRDVAGIPASACPKINDSLTIVQEGFTGPKDYALDALERNDGYEARFILRRAK